MLKNLRAFDKKEKVLCKIKVITNEGCFLIGNSHTKAHKVGKNKEYEIQEIKEGHFVYFKDLELYKLINKNL